MGKGDFSGTIRWQSVPAIFCAGALAFARVTTTAVAAAIPIALSAAIVVLAAFLPHAASANPLPPVRIGLSGPFSGGSAAMGESLRQARAQQRHTERVGGGAGGGLGRHAGNVQKAS